MLESRLTEILAIELAGQAWIQAKSVYLSPCFAWILDTSNDKLTANTATSLCFFLFVWISQLIRDSGPWYLHRRLERASTPRRTLSSSWKPRTESRIGVAVLAGPAFPPSAKVHPLERNDVSIVICFHTICDPRRYVRGSDYGAS